ncbi:MAG: hypothetical protein JST40_12360 [Armatimonadetes bacterium]|nr:hypothetical protein [Armatimonadota bacterium]
MSGDRMERTFNTLPTLAGRWTIRKLSRLVCSIAGLTCTTGAMADAGAAYTFFTPNFDDFVSDSQVWYDDGVFILGDLSVSRFATVDWQNPKSFVILDVKCTGGGGSASTKGGAALGHGCYTLDEGRVGGLGGSVEVSGYTNKDVNDLVFHRTNGGTSSPIRVLLPFSVMLRGTISRAMRGGEGAPAYSMTARLEFHNDVFQTSKGSNWDNVTFNYSSYLDTTVPCDVPVHWKYSTSIYQNQFSGAWITNRRVVDLDEIDMKAKISSRPPIGAPEGPVFELPEGYTADCPSMGIVDNHWTVPEAYHPGTVMGKVNLGQLAGTVNTIPVIWSQNGIEVSRDTLVIGDDGSYELESGLTGIYDLEISPETEEWHGLLRKRMTLTLSSAPVAGVNFKIYAGDIDHDGAVTVFDYLYLSNWFDRTPATINWFAEDSNHIAPKDADLDSDDMITIFDYAILTDGFDQVGD